MTLPVDGPKSAPAHPPAQSCHAKRRVKIEVNRLHLNGKPARVKQELVQAGQGASVPEPDLRSAKLCMFPLKKVLREGSRAADSGPPRQRVMARTHWATAAAKQHKERCKTEAYEGLRPMRNNHISRDDKGASKHLFSKLGPKPQLVIEWCLTVSLLLGCAGKGILPTM